MTDTQDLTRKFWAALRHDMTVMLGTTRNALGQDGVGPRPMTAQIDGDRDQGPIWFFTARDTELARAVDPGTPAFFTFADKGNDVFATVTGRLTADNDRAVIDRLWNAFVAAWYEGKDDPALVLLRFDPDDAEIWLDGSSLVAGLKILLGGDPKADYADHTAKVRLSSAG